MLPECLDDYVAEENPVTPREVFVDELDLGGLGFEGMDPAATGRPAYHPSVLLKIYIYGYLNRVQSSRRLEREARRNVELMAAMDTADRTQSEVAEPKAVRLKDKIEKLKQQMQGLKEMEQRLREAPDGQVSLTDPDARSIATSGRGTGVVGYNVQTAVDDKCVRTQFGCTAPPLERDQRFRADDLAQWSLQRPRRGCRECTVPVVRSQTSALMRL